MQASRLRMTPRHSALIHFGLDDKSAERTASVEDRLSRYQTGWEQLLHWDRTAHSVPVFQQMNLPKVVESARSFLERQAGKKTSETLPFLIGITGGSASGKTTIKKSWARFFNLEALRQIGWRKKTDGPIVNDVDLDNYYKDRFVQRKQLGDEAFFRETNLDCPKALTLKDAIRDVFLIKNGKVRRTPKYDPHDSSRREGALYKLPAPFFMVEGLFALQPKTLRNLLDMKIFVATDETTRAQRWWQRAPERNVHNNPAGQALFTRTMSMHDKHVEPTRRYADVVVNGAAAATDIQESMKRLTRLMLKTLSPKATR